MARGGLLAVAVIGVRRRGAGSLSDARYSARSETYTGGVPEPYTDTPSADNPSSISSPYAFDNNPGSGTARS